MSEGEVHAGPQVLLHDGSFAGFLTVVFEAFRLRLEVQAVESSLRHEPQLFEQVRSIDTCSEKAQRVWTGIERRGGAEIAAMVRAAFLSELSGIATVLYSYLCTLFEGVSDSRGRNILDENTHAIYDAARKTRHEAHRFAGMVRFSRAPDGSMFAVIAPDHDILALLASHFQERFPGFPWLIADSRRGHCLHFDGREVRLSSCDPATLPRDAGQVAQWADSSDARYQDLWQCFYDGINIRERYNRRLLERNLPRKYWAYLPERAGSRPSGGPAGMDLNEG